MAAFSKNRTKIWVGAVTLLLVFYLVVSFQRSVLLLMDSNLAAKAIGAAYLVLPVIGAWALVRELMFGARTEQMAKVLEAEGGNMTRTAEALGLERSHLYRKMKSLGISASDAKD